MTPKIPLGEAEDETLEFKSRDALDRPAVIARSVVSFLNARGGTLWIGLEEHAGRAIEIRPIDDPDLRQRQLLDYLVSAIEPSPSIDEIRIDQVNAGHSGVILLVTARPDKARGPYAHLKEGGRFYIVRIGDRTRPMSREEVLSSAPVMDDGATKALEKARRSAQSTGEARFWLWVRPVGTGRVDVQDPHLVALLSDPAATGNRPAGWTFVNRHAQPELKGEKLVLGKPAFRQLEICSDGLVAFSVPLERLSWIEEQDQRLIWPYALMEYPVSVFRLASKLYAQHRSGLEKVLADLALIGVVGWGLRPYSPNSLGFDIEDPSRFEDADDLLFAQPFEFRPEEFIEHPDRCALRLIAEVYQAFGHDRSKIPSEFDQREGQLLIPGS